MSSEEIRYVEPSDDGHAYAIPDHSSALKGNQLGLTLCFQNPLEDRLYKRHVTKLNKQWKRREVVFHHNQKTFFIQQVFEKGLNPYVREKAGRSGRAEGKAKLQEEKGANSGTEQVKTGERGPPSLPLIRSHTTGDLPSAVKDQESRGMVARSTPAAFITQQKRGESLPDVTRSLDDLSQLDQGVVYSQVERLPPLTESTAEWEEEEEEEEGEEDVEKENVVRPPPRRSLKRTLSSLRKRPENMFPKLNQLVGVGLYEDTQKEESSVEKKPIVSHKKPEPTKKKENKPMQKLNKANYIKMIQRLTAYLPDQLAETAKEQIRTMSNSDVIYEKKRVLLEQNKHMYRENPTTDDQRWRDLEKSLSPTHGMGKSWRRLPGHKWTLRQ